MSINVNADHFANPSVAATSIPTLVSDSVSSHSYKAEGEDRRNNSPHVCIVLDVKQDMSEGTWSLHVVGRSYGSSLGDGLAENHDPDAYIPLRVPDGHYQPPTPAAFGLPLDCDNYRYLVPIWVVAVGHELHTGRSDAVRCNLKFNPTEPRANFSAMKYQYFNPRVNLGPGELARLKDYLSKRRSGLGSVAGGGSGGIPPGITQGDDSSHAGQPPNGGHFNHALHSMRPCPWSVCC